MRPLIGLTTSELRRGSLGTLRREGAEPHPEMALGMTYARAIERAGGMAVVLPLAGLDAVGELLDRLDGVCLSGGPDLDPSAYGAGPHPELGVTEPALDAYELAVLRAAEARGLPVLGVCRGAQAINIARGGTLRQHVGGHSQDAAATRGAHAVRIAPRSRLREIVRARELQVNSFHHQAVDRLGDGLRLSARAPDGTVEAIEDPRHRFLIGVQWHAEAMAEHRALFEALIAAAAQDRTRAVLTAAA
jgi:putative glutamine amidotransferase